MKIQERCNTYQTLSFLKESLVMVKHTEDAREIAFVFGEKYGLEKFRKWYVLRRNYCISKMNSILIIYSKRQFHIYSFSFIYKLMTNYVYNFHFTRVDL